jgi:pseudouridine-5'-phosphate glycosidase
VTVVAAGAKAILDIPKTLEVLETQGVPVITFGQDNIPAFWSRESGLLSPLRMDTAAQIAAAHRLRAQMGIPGGQLICNPIPKDAEISADILAPIISRAQADADTHGIMGKGVTPYLLQRIFELTEGKSLTANIALVRNNARLAAGIAQNLTG